MEQEKLLSMVVLNPQALQAGLTPMMTFDASGGVIGTDASATWRLKGLSKEALVFPRHCEIRVVEHQFCVKDLCGETYVNGASMPLGRHNMARLGHHDTLHLGELQIRVSSDDTDVSPLGENAHLAPLLHHNDDLLSHAQADVDAPVLKTQDDRELDPMALLEQTHPTPQVDELLKPQIVSSQSGAALSVSDELCQPAASQADREFERSSAVALKKRTRFNPFSSSFWQTPKRSITTERPDDSHWLSSVSQDPTRHSQTEDKVMETTLDLLNDEAPLNENGESNHLLSGPLFKGLGVNITEHHQAQDIQRMSEEVGAALQAAIRGILALHQHVDNGRYGVINKNLQPIEDNPLRLGLPYQETVQTLFQTDAVPVHLSAPSSISESLKNLKDHNDVVQIATTMALSQIVQAFSPETLMRRFQRYRRSYDLPEKQQGEWAWKMYQHYYQELTSERQQGFEKLFWEIFEQSYDRLLREKQSEG